MDNLTGAHTLVLALACALQLGAQDSDRWRYWTASHGLRESYAYSLTLDPTEGALEEWKNGRWIEHFRAPPGRRLIAAAGSTIGPSLALTAGTREIRIAGEHGLATLDISRRRAPFEWREITGAVRGLHHFRDPLPGRDGSVLAQACEAGGRFSVCAGHPPGWSGCTSSEGAHRGWDVPDGAVWILDGTLRRAVPGKRLPLHCPLRLRKGYANGSGTTSRRITLRAPAPHSVGRG